MDARAMEDHDWDECGSEVADLFRADDFKSAGIRRAWWDLDEDDQILIHEFVCEDRRDPDAAEAVLRFETLAAQKESRLREDAAEREKRAQANPDETRLGLNSEAYAKFQHLLLNPPPDWKGANS